MRRGWQHFNIFSHHAGLKNSVKYSICFLVTFFFSAFAFANPVLNHIVSGNVSVSQSTGSTVINQSTQKGIISWNSFNINANEKTQFIQPNSRAITLNRISSQQGASQIFGSLSANGQIILVNGAGIYFGPTASVNVGGIIATTSDISNSNFLNGKMVFDKPSTQGGSITNAGSIIASQHGLVALLGSNVTNKWIRNRLNWDLLFWDREVSSL